MPLCRHFAGDLSTARAAFEEAWALGLRNAHLAAAVLKAEAELGDWRDAVKIVERHRDSGARLDEVSHAPSGPPCHGWYIICFIATLMFVSMALSFGKTLD
eukprot:scaffold261198_cov36-Prasinocladus_malaysianus.AAC.1